MPDVTYSDEAAALAAITEKCVALEGGVRMPVQPGMIGVSAVVAATSLPPNLICRTTCVPPDGAAMRACWPALGRATAAEAEPDDDAVAVAPGVNGGIMVIG